MVSPIGAVLLNIFLHPGDHRTGVIIIGGLSVGTVAVVAFLVKTIYGRCSEKAPNPDQSKGPAPKVKASLAEKK